MKDLKYVVPNLFTALSLTSALFALNFTYEKEFVTASWLIGLSALFDGLDGKIARLLNASSRFGATFDTLSDFVAFGVVPAFLSYKLFLYNYGFWGIIISLFYIFCGGYRLVRFTLKHTNETTKKSFTGLPIPVAASLISSFIILNFYIWGSLELKNIYFIVIFLSSVLMISKIEYLPIEKRSRLTKEAKFFIVLALISVVISIKFSYVVFGFWVLLYILYGIIRQIVIKINK